MTALEILIAIVLPLVLAELLGWLPWLAKALARRAATKLPATHRLRYREEWLAEIEFMQQERGGLAVVAWAAVVFLRVNRTARDLRQAEKRLRFEVETGEYGTLDLASYTVSIPEGVQVSAEIYGRSIEVFGEVDGDLHATDQVTIHASARVDGEVTAPRVRIEEAARFTGTVRMSSEYSMAKESAPPQTDGVL